MKNLYFNKGNPDDAEEDLGSQYILDLLSKYQLKEDDLIKAFDYCRMKGVMPLCTPWDMPSADFLNNYGMEGFKIASADFTNHELLKNIAQYGKVMICSTGMCTEQEVRAGVEVLIGVGAQFLLLHCNSTYPSPFKDINLNYIKRLQQISPFPVGYSGHERGIQVALASVVMGAKIVEKHFTFDRSMEGNGHKISLLPEEFKEMVDGIRVIEEAIGGNKERTISQGELINRENLGKSLIAEINIKKGEVIGKEKVVVKSPGKGLPPYRINDLLGKTAHRDIKQGDCFYEEDLNGFSAKPRRYNFQHPYGIPVRYHDLEKLVNLCPMDLIEFLHLSYKDLNLDMGKYLRRAYPHRLVVHSPELFAGDHVLDLCSRDQDYREKSIGELQRVINVANDLKRFFPNEKKPLIVVNAGGFSANRFLGEEENKELYDILIASLRQLNQDGVELIPQTMPPFPWHFGGQRYHNIFVDPSEILKFCESTGYRICLDISHSKLACNYSKSSFRQFLEKVAPVTAHIHISDAPGIDGEGLQIDEGEINFKILMSQLSFLFPNISFIPEIWQGHKNNGNGFWVSLERIEKHCTGLLDTTNKP